MKKKDMQRCTQLTNGIVIDLKNKGLDFPTIVTVEYEVLGVFYQISESIKYRSEFIKIGFLPIGQKKIPKLGSTVVGSSVRVSYNPDNPDVAYLPDNIGKINV